MTLNESIKTEDLINCIKAFKWELRFSRKKPINVLQELEDKIIKELVIKNDDLKRDN